MEYQRDEHRVHLIVYHLIWCPKRRKRILVEPVATTLHQLIEDKCAQRGWDILQLAIQPDHVHLFVRVFPTNSAADVVGEIKGYTSHELRQLYPSIVSKLPSLWTRSYFASTAGNVSEATIRAYIEAQKGK
ncbi:MAG: IS200/IS605 family transposase [Chloroflexota bacterium]|nr:IS200/IS605 family transposase [Chloroflexota bacterium]